MGIQYSIQSDDHGTFNITDVRPTDEKTTQFAADGGFFVTVCQDQAGLDESTQNAKDWIAKNAANTGVAAPEVIVGSVIKHL
jgi:hypothetical protein